MLNLLNDSETYEIIKKDPSLIIERRLNKYSIKRLAGEGLHRQERIFPFKI